MPPKDELVRLWLLKARDDLVMARRAMELDPAIIDGACYHVQQAVEESLKAVLVLREVEPPRTHDIGLLLKRCGEIDERLNSISQDLVWLTSFGVDVRYPGVGEDPTANQAREALSLAQTTLAIVSEIVPESDRP